MREFYAQYCKRFDDRVNPDIFERSFDKPLWQYIVDTCKNLEVLPPITFDGYDLITDQTKIKLYVNKPGSKDSKIRNNKTLERLIPAKPSICDMLKLHFTVNLRGQVQHVTRQMLVFKQLRGCRYYIRGKYVTPIIQIVDNSTYVKDDSLKFKTTLVPIEINTSSLELKFTDGTKINCRKFNINLFSKICNPLLYFLAKFDLYEVINLFNMDSIMAIVHKEIDQDKYLYLKISDMVFIEINKKALKAHEFVLSFLGTLYDALFVKGQKSQNMKKIYSKKYWIERLGEIFGKKTRDKGERVLISFAKIMDPTTTKNLSIGSRHKKNTHMVVRWMMVNYPELLKKNNHDLKNKRVRSVECIAHYFDAYVTRNINSLLNNDNVTFDRYLRLLKSIGEFTLFKAIGGTNPYNLFRYEEYNDFHAINLSRYTFKGPTGLKGGKKKTGIQYKDIYESQIGRLDLNTGSAENKGLSGYLTINCKVDSNGRFCAELVEPDSFEDDIRVALAGIGSKEYKRTRGILADDDRMRDEEGYITLERRMTAEELIHELNLHPSLHGLYRGRNGDLMLIPDTDIRDKKGYIILEHVDQHLDAKTDVTRDEDGFIILEPVRAYRKWNADGTKIEVTDKK